MFLPIKDVEALQKELQDNFIINKELSSLAGSLSLRFGRLLALANAALITTRYIDFSVKIPVDSTSLCEPLSAVDVVPAAK